MCLRSMCLPNDICSSVRRMCRVSTMSLSHASGWLRLALSLLGILDLIPWNRCNICVCSFWNVELRMALHTRSICLETCHKTRQSEWVDVVHWVEQGSSLLILQLKERGQNNSLKFEAQLSLSNKRLSQSSNLKQIKNYPNKKGEHNYFITVNLDLRTRKSKKIVLTNASIVNIKNIYVVKCNKR